MTEKPTIEQLISDVKNHQDWRVRKQSIQQLGEYDTTEAMDAIITALYDDSPHVVQTATYALKPFGKDAVDGLLEALYSPEDIISRRFIIHVLDDVGGIELVPHFIHFLDDSDAGMHYAAALALTKIPDEQAMPHLLKSLKREDAATAQIIQALGVIGNPVVIPELVPFLSDDDYVTCRYTAIVLGQHGTAVAVQALLDATHSSESHIQRAAIEGLGQIDSEETFERLKELLDVDDQQVRSSVISALGKSKRTESLTILVNELEKQDRRTVAALRVALGNTGNLNAIPPLLKLYRTDRSQDGRGLSGLCRNYWKFHEVGSSILPQVLQAIHSPDKLLKLCAIWLFHGVSFNYADPNETTLVDFQVQHINEFEKLLKDRDADVRLVTLVSLAKGSLQLAEQAIIKCLEDEDLLIREMAAKALGFVKTTNSINALINATKTTNDKVRRNVVSSLAMLGGEVVINTFHSLLTHNDNWTRRLAVRGLGSLKSKRSVHLLIDAFDKEPELDVRASIIWTLGDIGDPIAIPTIIDVLQVEDDGIAHNSPFDSALYALQINGDNRALPSLYRIIDNGSKWQRRMRAVEALSRIDSEQEVADRLFKLLEHADDTVRTTASKELGYLGARTQNLKLRDYIVSNLIQRLQDVGRGYHYSPTVAHMAAKSLYYVGTPEANEALRNWELKRDDSASED